MKVFNRIGRGLAAGVLSMAMLGGVGLPAFASNVSNNSCAGRSAKTAERQELRTMTEKMFAQAKANDLVLENLASKLNKAPEPQKVDIEAALLTEIVTDHHAMVKNWEGIHNQIAQFKTAHATHGNLAQSQATPQK